MKPYQTEYYKGYTIKIFNDDSYDGRPDDSGDDSLFLVGYSRRDFWVEAKGFDADTMADPEAREDIVKKYYIFPLRAYIHSGVALSLGTGYPFDCPWDSCYIGYVFAEKHVYGLKDEAEKAAESLVNEWNDVLSGNVWGYVVEDPDGNRDDESCWGFVGDIDYCLREARNIVDYNVEQDIKAQQQKRAARRKQHLNGRYA